ncbi:hypothetical protein OPT61_g1546 [Boeremia exigua]|uniref:Uncharacterized protein n=1 Tax=Boeremia exigua TaxID=749465 RepID=A0ACC2IPY7_9PLEO|nr:hypothetical protein OPT61_g1546 [Boeremia exigua]
MAEKRAHDGESSRPAKKQNKGFQIGPANLPDGTHRRKVKKIKENIIYKAKLKKQYAKLKAREEDAGDAPRKSVYEREAEANGEDEPAEAVSEPTLEPHPDRVRMLEEPEKETPTFDRRQKRARPQPFQKEAEIARKKQEQADARQKAREEAERERTKKIAERERFRKAMAKARGGPNGQRKLGRESKVLLEKAQRLMGKS